MYKIIEMNCETGELVERDMTEEEILAKELEQQMQEQAELAKQSGLEKLKALGLTEEEINAITGKVE